ncbi:MAG TPA: dTDP-4-dehydrorhamnose 3,5-epimerase [Longimicrobium sp.]|jgi:dTDP-4-dehydrorhamnose 3,5-epimerase
MRILPTRIPGVVLVEPPVHADERGYFMESWNHERYAAAGVPARFVQDNLSLSRRHVLRGLHFQNPRAQGKLVSVLRGAVFDVAVDLRQGSPHFGEWVGVELSEENRLQLYVPEGFAHGFVVTSDAALFSYKCTDVYVPECERSLRWDDPDVGIRWPVERPVLSPKDAAAPLLRDLPGEALFAAAAGAATAA